MNETGANRAPRPSRYPPYGPRSDSTGTPASRRIATYRRAARSLTPSRAANCSDVVPGRSRSTSSARNARAVGLISVFATPDTLEKRARGSGNGEAQSADGALPERASASGSVTDTQQHEPPMGSGHQQHGLAVPRAPGGALPAFRKLIVRNPS
ncbi:hypothetical protein GCM10009759_13140 [Kitasatospora saccharophila]|uniref:Uncharacterized protein n=1 Tax=Kitasatospora saccharophila TaxID=407973 RepID=A0ABN2WEC2_9ACTN